MSNKIYFTPGPSQLFYTFNGHLKDAISKDIPSISHRNPAIVEVLKHAKDNLRELLEIPEDYDIYFLSSANEAWDRIIQNLVIQSSHHFANGAFSKKFYDFATQYGMKSTVNQVGFGESFEDLSVPDEAELIGITKNETSIGYTFSEDDIATIRKQNPDKLIALDVVSATPAIPTNYSNVDTAYFSVQKAFGLPPGLGVWICNQKCLDKVLEKSKQTSLGSYRALPNLKKFSDKNQTPETPNTLLIYLLGKIAEDMLNVGKQKVINDTIYKSTLLYQTIVNHPRLSPFVQDANYQSKTTIVAEAADQSLFLESLKTKGMIIGKGYGDYKEKHIRIANFPTHSKESIEMLCDYISVIE